MIFQRFYIGDFGRQDDVRSLLHNTSNSVSENSNNTDDVITQNSVTDLVFLWSVVIVGMIGTVANGIVLSALLDKKLRRQTSNILTIYQVVLDLASCLSLAISYAITLGLGGEPMTQSWGYVVCMIFTSDGLDYILVMRIGGELGDDRLREVHQDCPLRHAQELLQKVREF